MVISINGIPLSNSISNPITENLRQWSKEQAIEIILGALDAAKDIVVDLSYTVTLVGSGLCLLFWVVGWQDGKRWSGILMLAYVVIKMLLG